MSSKALRRYAGTLIIGHNKITLTYTRTCSTMYYRRGDIMSFSIRLNEQEEKLFKRYADFHGCSLGEAFKNALLEKIEDEYDIALAEQAHNEFTKDSETISHEDLMKELGL